VIYVNASVAALFAIVFVIIIFNFYFLVVRNRRGGNRYKRMNRTAVDEAKQALWRDNEVKRRIEREEEDALERVKLRNETLALYDEVRKRATERDSEGALLTGSMWEDINTSDIERFR